MFIRINAIHLRMAVRVKDLPIRPAAENQVDLGNWCLHTSQSHILRSQCKCKGEVQCNHCVYNNTLNIPDLPEMTFDRNMLTLTHVGSGCSIKLNTLDALKLVDDKQDLIKVSYSEEWLAKRQDSSHIKNTPKPFDWTFSTAYSGTLTNSPSHKLSVSTTTQEPDQEKLMRRDKILHHAELVMFEDELADNGSSKLLVKCRVMPTFILILLRHYLRVDKVMIRVQETRLYCEEDWDYFLRDVTLREASFNELNNLPTSTVYDEWGINQYLRVLRRDLDKISIVQCN